VRIDMPGHDYERDEAVITESEDEIKLEEPPRYRVLLHNDDFTTMEFVIFVLESVFQHSTFDAIRLMYQVHTEGVAVGGVYPYEIAETKVAKVTQLAREHEYPFLCTMEEE
jgi:ATP-dependent Clp protease adaptor protein ClpS